MNYLKKILKEKNIHESEIARVIKEHKEHYIVVNNDIEYSAEITGKLRFSASSREDFPAVGDWVIISKQDKNQAIIYDILPRNSILQRKSINSFGEKQVIATNIDIAFIIQSVDNNFNLNRLERYETIAISGKIKPAIILSKTDLISEDDLKEKISLIRSRNKTIDIICISNVNQNGINELASFMQKDKTYCFLGSSGVGKSTLINSLLNNEILETSEISSSTGKGKHTTTHRELIKLPNQSFVIDTPGMREIGITESAVGLESTFSEIYELAKTCKFSDCTHTNEPGCAILNAINNNEIDEKKFENFKKLEKEAAYLESTIAERRQKDKEFGKMVKQIMKNKK